MATLDESFMERALELAEHGRGAVEPNPFVGAVVVQNGQIVGEGWHQKFGQAHAEVNALNAAGANSVGSTLYVTLEPCCHHGKTPPCTERVIASGVRRVVIAMTDPYPEVAGKGIAALQSAGLEVAIGPGAQAALRLNAPYMKLIRCKRPFVHAKWAMSLDGKIATATGESKWITGEAARRHAHQFRGLVDAIVVGAGTVTHDDPLLTARPPGARVATRIVLDSKARIGMASQLVKTAKQIPTIVATTANAPREPMDRLTNAGVECLILPTTDGGGVSVDALLDELGKRRFTNVLIEGGASTLAAFCDINEIDAARIYIAPRLIGGANAPGPFAGGGIHNLADSPFFELDPPLTLDGDLFLHALRRPRDAHS